MFRALLTLYPAAFRDEYHRELTLVFVDRSRDTIGWRDRVTLWFDVLTGLAKEAPKEHYRMIRQDLFYATRLLWKHRLVTATIVVTLGLGIGVNTAIFSLLNAVVLRALPVPDADRLFAVRAAPPVASGNRFSGPMFERVRASAPDGVVVAAMSRVAQVYARLDATRETEPVSLQLVSPAYFDLLGVPPAIGRSLPGAQNAQDASRAHEPLAVVSHAYWQRSLGGSADVIGRALIVNNAPFTIVGVAPPAFGGVWLESPVDIWVPLSAQDAVKYSQNYSADGVDATRPWIEQERIWWLDVIVRTRADDPMAAAALGAFTAGIQQQLPPPVARAKVQMTVEPFAKGFSLFRRHFATPLLALTVMAAFVLLIACANVANLLLARAAARQREIAVRMSLGAGRLRVMHQLLTESALLVAMAAGAALLFARWAGDLIVRVATASSTGAAPFAASIDLRVLGFTAAVALTSVLLFGVLPAWRTTRLDFVGALKAGTRGAIGGSTARPARLLVVLQVALSLVLVTGTGLLARSFYNMLTVDLGFERDRLLTVTIDPRLSGTGSTEWPALHQRLLDGVAPLPGVRSAALAMCGLQSNCRSRMDGFTIEGYDAQPDEQVVFLVNIVTPDYFSTVGMRLIAGRALSERDLAQTPDVAVVNRTLAAKYFKDGQAIGRRFGTNALDIEIVGIVDDARTLNVKDPPGPAVFFPLTQRPVVARALEVRTTGDPRQAIASVRRAIGVAAPTVPIEAILPVETRIRTGLSQERLLVLLTSGFGALALGLAGFGLFGVLSCAVARRTPEIGVRLALGASRSQILWSVVRDAQWLVLYGFLLGVPVAIVGGRLLSTLLFDVNPYDVSLLLAAVLTLIVVAVGCSAIPALRALRIDPTIALRQD